MSKKSILSAITVSLALFASPKVNAQAVAGDYDGDGRADLAIIDADQSEDKTTVFVRRSSDGREDANVFFPFGDFVISGNFYGGRKTYAGIVSNRRSSGALQWRIKNPLGPETVFNFGNTGDEVPNQGDLDCDGTVDLVLVRNDPSGFKIWYSVMSSHPGVYQSTLFGESGDKPFVADVDGDGCSEIIALRGDYNWYSRGFFATTFKKVQWGLPGDIPLTPADLNADGRPDYIVSRVGKNSQTAFIRFGDNSSMTLSIGSAKSIPFTGDYFSLGSVLGWFERARGQFVVRYPNSTQLKVNFGNPRRGLVRPDGTVVTEEEDGRYTAGGNNSSMEDGVDCDAQIKRSDGPGGFVYNPETSKGTAKVVLPSSYNEKVDKVSAYQSGDRLEVLRYAGFEVRDRRRWYFSKRPSSYPDDILVVVKMKTGENRCVTIPDPEKRYD